MVIIVQKLKWSDLYSVKSVEVFTMKQTITNSKYVFPVILSEYYAPINKHPMTVGTYFDCNNHSAVYKHPYKNRHCTIGAANFHYCLFPIVSKLPTMDKN